MSKELRENAGLSVLEIAALAGVSKQAVYNWENKERKDSYPPDILMKLEIMCLKETGNDARKVLVGEIKLLESISNQLGNSLGNTNKDLQKLLKELNKGE